MDFPEDRRRGNLKLRTLFEDAGVASLRLGAGRRIVRLRGRMREWSIVAHADPDWLNLYTVVCSVPELPGMRSRLFEEILRANRRMRLTKFVVNGDFVALELDYFAEHVDAQSVDSLVAIMFSTAEEMYPSLFRIAAGDDVLEALDDAR